MLKMPSVFSDHMVLQRNKKLVFWGETDQSEVRLSFCGKEYRTVLETSPAQKMQRWEITTPPMPEGGPYRMTVAAGGDRLDFDDVYLGEVWLAGGQSNMEFEIHKSAGGKEVLDKAFGWKAQADVGANVRFYKVSRIAYAGGEFDRAQEENRWQVYGEETMADWSAVGYHFAREVSQALGVMVGIIGCNWGGTSASAWTSRKKLLEKKSTSVYVEEYDEAVKGQTEEQYLKDWAYYIKYQAEFDQKVGLYYETNKNPTWEEALELYGPSLYPGPMGPRNEKRPGGLYEVMFQSVVPYQLAGFLFYQGEEDDTKASIYAELLESMIDEWRRDFGDEELPFLFVMLPMFLNIGEKDPMVWPLIREAQQRVHKKLKNTGLANIMEYGEYGNIHPLQKKPVGERLAKIALYQVYGFEGLKEKCYGPELKASYADGNKMYLSFHGISGAEDLCYRKQAGAAGGDGTDRADAGHAGQDKGGYAGFEVAGKDGVYYEAKACFGSGEKSGMLVLESPNVEEPCSARYLWRNYAEVELFGRNGIPLAPFRTSC